MAKAQNQENAYHRTEMKKMYTSSAKPRKHSVSLAVNINPQATLEIWPNNVIWKFKKE
jgi:hypothetical protein